MELKRLKVSFKARSGQDISGVLELPFGTPDGFALLVHSPSAPLETSAAECISNALCQAGIAVLRFEFTSDVNDIVTASDYLRARHQAPRLLIGHGLGGAAVLEAADRIAESTAVATIGAPVPEDVPPRTLTEAIGRTGKALLVFHSPADQEVGIEHAREIYEASYHPKSFVSLDQADHRLTNRRDATYVAQVLAAWVSRYLEPEEQTLPDRTLPSSEELPPEGEVWVTEHGPRYAQEIHAGHHLIRSDEPVSVGGADSGPTPYDLLTAALGACTSMTLRMYADLKKIPLERVRVRLRHSKIHARDCAECETRTGKIDHIHRWIEMEGELTREQRQRLIQIADRCPVHRSLEEKVHIRTKEFATDGAGHPLPKRRSA